MKKNNFCLVCEIFPKLPTLFFYLYLMRLLSDCKTVLDIGCGANSPLRFLNSDTFGIDISKSAIRQAKIKKTHRRLRVLNALLVGKFFKTKTFDAVVALDLIEHLKRREGLKLLKDMENISRKKVIIFTPNGFLSQRQKGSYNKHRSGWDTKIFEDLGYQVYGIYGPKWLRSEYYKIKYQPEFFWALISDIFQWLYIFRFPQKAAALLCIKKLKNI